MNPALRRVAHVSRLHDELAPELYAAVETSQPWGVEQPSNLFLLEYLLLLSLLSIAATVAFKSLRKPSDLSRRAASTSSA